MNAFMLERQNWVSETETICTESQEYLLSGPLQKSLLTPNLDNIFDRYLLTSMLYYYSSILSITFFNAETNILLSFLTNENNIIVLNLSKE